MRLARFLVGILVCSLLPAVGLADDVPASQPATTHPATSQPAHQRYPAHKIELLSVPEQTELGKLVVDQVNSGTDGQAFHDAVEGKVHDLIAARPPKPDPKAKPDPANKDDSSKSTSSSTSLTDSSSSGSASGGPTGDLEDEDYRFLGLYTYGRVAHGEPSEDITRALKAQIKKRTSDRKTEKDLYDAAHGQASTPPSSTTPNSSSNNNNNYNRNHRAHM